MIVFFDIEIVSVLSKEERTSGKAYEKYGEKISFMPEFNKVLTIVVGAKHKDGIKTSILFGDEKEIIEKFYSILENTKDLFLSGFNILNFDIPFLVKRGIYYKIPVPEALKFYGKPKWDLKHIIDLKDVYNMGVFGGIGNLDSCCEFFGITSPKEKGIDGSKVQEFYDSGKEEEIHQYCERDVIATAELYEIFKSYNLV